MISPNSWDVDHLERLRLYDSKDRARIVQWGIHKAKNLLVGIGEVGQDLPDEQQEGGGPAIHYASHHLRCNTCLVPCTEQPEHERMACNVSRFTWWFEIRRLQTISQNVPCILKYTMIPETLRTCLIGHQCSVSHLQGHHDYIKSALKHNLGRLWIHLHEYC